VAIQERFREVGAMLDESNLLDSKNALFSISPEQRSPGLFLVLQVRQPHLYIRSLMFAYVASCLHTWPLCIDRMD
jgi:hypothetical protein